ncbi:hypothetical protein L1987_53194 [Smallanthus sonchifolius]|uniref:Uncharacterized protein n=1 Tax=Smallanthus sonchifolius TaxID=185202 RepID=A0ACB9EVZ7_9ASTR|nr:hypothetical protein L1987_53194 [Smallanthus sonchifolius]
MGNTSSFLDFYFHDLLHCCYLTLLKLCGDIGALGWWDLFINFGIAECFAFLVCTNWSNPAIHRNHQSHYASSSSSSSKIVAYWFLQIISQRIEYADGNILVLS